MAKTILILLVLLVFHAWGLWAVYESMVGFARGFAIFCLVCPWIGVIYLRFQGRPAKKPLP